jgi:hypothetical protein
MANTKINSFTTMLSFFIIFIFILTGCTGTIQNLGVSMMPTYQEVVDSWPEIEEGKGRAVFYFVKQEGSNLMAAFLDLMIDQDKKQKATFSDRIFVFADLFIGDHSVEIRWSHWAAKWKKFDIKIEEGEILYAKIDFIKHKDGYVIPTLQVVDRSEALIDIESFHGIDKSISKNS